MQINKSENFFLKNKNEIIEFTKGVFNIAFIFILVFGFIRPFIGAPFKVDGESMLHTLDNGDILIVSKINYLVTKPERGDVAVLHPPYDDKVYYVKRIMGVPGDKLSFQNNSVYLNDIKLEEKYTNGETRLPYPVDGEIKIAPDHFFVMGDNREHSTDSRYWVRDLHTIVGAIPRKNVEGRALLRIKMQDTGIKIFPQIFNIGPVTLRIPYGVEVLYRPKY